MALNNNWKGDYSKNESDYKLFQSEAKGFVEEVVSKHSDAIHVAKIEARPKNKIKSLESIENNHNTGRYNKHKTIFDVKDISGVRVTCHCEDDVENLTTV